jgi:small-conductance mechanosensitive channel
MKEVSRQIIAWLSGPGLYALLVLAGAFALDRLARFGIRRVAKRFARSSGEAETEREKRTRALASVLSGAVGVAIYGMAAVSVLDRFGVRTGSLIASLGIIGVALGFGAQTLVRDLISGFFMLAEGQLTIGDNVSVQTASGQVKGTVEKIGLRTTTIRGSEGEAQIVPNGEIRFVSNYSKEWSKAVVDIVTDPASVNAVSNTMQSVARRLFEDAEWSKSFMGEPQFLGIEEFEKDSVRLRLVARVMPSRQAEIAREIKRRVLDEMAANGLIGTSPGE